ncbi:hypothetical protein KC19_6G144400 [Ceratodon purpureus]|uniref:Uncharacterized protein n=1 Tax=Ceratodon purpureus TaxID=3225 RepID=A0A8T0HEM1_CERPU|nr:hypothetical protein KC19_6G144400 [Ceratodon purpureus]
MKQKESWQLTDFSPQTLHFEVGPSTCKKRRYNSSPRESSCRPGTGLSRASSRLLLGLSLDGGCHAPCGLVR